MGFRP
jgi:hypothetical protein